MPKTFFNLPHYYEGLKARRIKQSGRLWLVKVINDPPPYWFVFIRSFNLVQDKKSGAKSIGVWRFQHEEEAHAKFEQLKPLFPAYQKRPPTDKQLAVRAAFAAASRKSSNKLRDGVSDESRDQS